MVAGTQRKLDPNQNSLLTKLLVQQFSRRVVGQEKATQVLVDILENHRAGFLDPSRPIGNALFLGPTGTGKTHVVEMFAESLLGNKKACMRIDCAEFQHSHEIAKLIGSPPGYLGHRETHPALTQEAIDQHHTATLKVSIILFDEIEKASDSLWSLLLGILDKATLTLGDNRKVDFSKTIIIMTSNLGAREMAKKDIGYGGVDENHDQEKLDKIALSATKARFTPEFLNRIEHIVNFKTLSQDQIREILEIELEEFKLRVAAANLVKVDPQNFELHLSPKAKNRLIFEGYDKAYGARHLKRAIGKYLQRPLAKMLNSNQIRNGDTVVVDDSGGSELDFFTHNRSTQEEPK